MPSFVTHYYFGQLAQKAVKLDDAVNEYPLSFNMGCQGPDLFFYYMDGAKHPDSSIPPASLGGFLHNHLIYEQFEYILDYVKKNGENGRAIAYAYGLLCHYAMDTVAHPFIYFMQEDVLPQFYPEKKIPALHILFETRLDNYVFNKKLNRSIKRFSNAVKTEKEDREAIADFHLAVFKPMIDVDIDKKHIVKAAKFFKSYQNVFDDPTKILPTMLKGVSAIASYPSKLYGFIHPKGLLSESEDWLNDTHRHWPRCRKEDEVVDWNFDEVLDRCVERIEYLASDFNSARENNTHLDKSLYNITYDGNRTLCESKAEAIASWNEELKNE